MIRKGQGLPQCPASTCQPHPHTSPVANAWQIIIGDPCGLRGNYGGSTKGWPCCRIPCSPDTQSRPGQTHGVVGGNPGNFQWSQRGLLDLPIALTERPDWVVACKIRIAEPCRVVSRDGCFTCVRDNGANVVCSTQDVSPIIRMTMDCLGEGAEATSDSTWSDARC